MTTLISTQPNMKKEYCYLDFAKLFFALMIPLLHISYNGGIIYTFLSQYVARLGVPFFFACTGFFLERALQKELSWHVGWHYIKRALILLCVWLCVYLPLYFVQTYTISSFALIDILHLFRKTLFMAPGYLWYLMALIVGEIVYCFLRISFKRNSVCIVLIAVGLYTIGVLLNSYAQVFNINADCYYSIFITSRNGLFFAPIMIWAGALSSEKRTNTPVYAVLIAAALYIFEVWFVRSKVSVGTDTSMYFSLPIVIFCLLSKILNIKTSNTFISKMSHNCRSLSILIYCIQYGSITCISFLVFAFLR